MYIIIKGKDKQHKLGKTRSQQEMNLRKEFGETMTDEQLDKLKYLEKKKKESDGSTKNFITGIDIDKVK